MRAWMEAFAFAAVGADDFMFGEQHVVIGHFTTFAPPDGLAVQQMNRRGQHFVLAEQQFAPPAGNQHPVLRRDDQFAVVADGAF